jgi:hypothetical protein
MEIVVRKGRYTVLATNGRLLKEGDADAVLRWLAGKHLEINVYDEEDSDGRRRAEQGQSLV